MFTRSARIRPFIPGAVSAVGVAMVAVAAMLVAPAAALAAPASARAHDRAMQPASSYTAEDVVYLHGRKITLWYNNDTYAYHAEISGGVPGDTIHLDYTNEASKLNGGYHVDENGVPPNGSYANTGDHVSWAARACGFVGSSSLCTTWSYGAGT